MPQAEYQPGRSPGLVDLPERAELWLPDLDELPFDAGLVRTLRRVITHRRDRIHAPA